MREIILENDNLKIKILTLGAILNSFYLKNEKIDIVLKLKDEKSYLSKDSLNIGKIIGRCANRIGNGKFLLNDELYTLEKNDGVNTLHGGSVNFGNVEWDILDLNKNKLSLKYVSKDLEAGFPGNLEVIVIYELDYNSLSMKFIGKTDKNTIFNMTNHSYFNLSVDKNILNHKLKINTNFVSLNDENGMALEENENVNGTIFDFRDLKKISEVVDINGIKLNEYCKNIKSNKKVKVDNIDNNFIFDNMQFKNMCQLKNENILLNIYSDMPCIQIYTGKEINIMGEDKKYDSYAGIAMEPQFCPNAINYTKHIKPILKKNEVKEYNIKYELLIGE